MGRRLRIIPSSAICVTIIFVLRVAISPNIPDHGKNTKAVQVFGFSINACQLKHACDSRQMPNNSPKDDFDNLDLIGKARHKRELVSD